jgi:hypothetical protein
VAQLLSLGIMRTLIKYFLPPAAPVIPLIGLALLVVIGESYSSSRIIDGHPDNAPIRAASLALLLIPIIYAGLLLIQFLCLRFQRPSRNFFTPYIIAIFGCALLIGFRNIYLMNWIALGFCAFLSATVIFPMAIFSWIICKRYDA